MTERLEDIDELIDSLENDEGERNRLKKETDESLAELHEAVLELDELDSLNGAPPERRSMLRKPRRSLFRR